jgi:hypothetical protein
MVTGTFFRSGYLGGWIKSPREKVAVTNFADSAFRVRTFGMV